MIIKMSQISSLNVDSHKDDSKNQLKIAKNYLAQQQKYNSILFYLIILSSVFTFFILLSRVIQYHKTDNSPCLAPRPRVINEVNIPIDVGQGNKSGFQHKDSPTSYRYPTVGMAIPQTYFNETRVQEEDLVKFDTQVLKLLKTYNDTNCKLTRFTTKYAGYVGCQHIIYDSQALVNIGVSQQDYFGCDLTTRKFMPNYQYSCTKPDYSSECLQNGNQNFFAPNVCVSDITFSSEGRLFYSLEDILKSRGLLNKKITIRLGQFQYKALKNMPRHLLQNFDQLFIDLRFSAETDVWGNIDIIKGLTQYMIPINVHSNNQFCFQKNEKKKRIIPSGSIQVTFANKKKIKKNSDSRTFFQSIRNKANKVLVGSYVCPIFD